MTEENSEELQDNWSVGQDLNPGHPKYEAFGHGVWSLSYP